MRTIGVALLGAFVLVATFASWLALYPVAAQRHTHPLAPPMPPRFLDGGRSSRPFFFPLRPVDAAPGVYAEDRRHPVRLVWLHGGRLISSSDEATAPWFPLGTDALGRDVWSRLLVGARLSLGLAAVACIGALGLGAILGGWAGARGGLVDEVVMRASELIIVLPLLYVVVLVRVALAPVLTPLQLFMVLTVVLAVAGAPQVARGVRAIVASESARDYAAAARAAGAGSARLLFRHLLPAATTFLETQALLLFPAFVLAEAALSYVGAGFAPPTPSWGTMLQDARDVRALVDAPWLLSPAVALTAVVFALNLVLDEDAG